MPGRTWAGNEEGAAENPYRFQGELGWLIPELATGALTRGLAPSTFPVFGGTPVT